MKGLEFYSAASQIIPLLLILLAFQAQSFGDRVRVPKWSAYCVVVVAFVGETCALIALYTEDPPRALYAPLVVLALVALGFLVFLAIVLAPNGGILSMRPSTRKD